MHIRRGKWKHNGKTLGKRREERHWVKSKNSKKEWSMGKEGGGKSNKGWGLEARGFTKKHSFGNLVKAWSPTLRIVRKPMNKLIRGSNSSVRIILLVRLGTTGYILIDLIKLNDTWFCFFFFSFFLFFCLSLVTSKLRFLYLNIISSDVCYNNGIVTKVNAMHSFFLERISTYNIRSR